MCSPHAELTYETVDVDVCFFHGQPASLKMVVELADPSRTLHHASRSTEMQQSPGLSS